MKQSPIPEVHVWDLKAACYLAKQGHDITGVIAFGDLCTEIVFSGTRVESDLSNNAFYDLNRADLKVLFNRLDMFLAEQEQGGRA